MKSGQCKAPKLLDVKSVRQTKCQNEKWQNQKLQIQMHIHIYQCMWSVIPGITCNFHVRPLCHPFPHVSEFLSGVVCGGGFMTGLELCNFHFKLFSQRSQCSAINASASVAMCTNEFSVRTISWQLFNLLASCSAAIKAKCQLLLAFSGVCLALWLIVLQIG